MVTIAIAAILATAAIASFQAAIRQQHATDVTAQLIQDIAWARGEALSGQSASITIAADGSWTAKLGGSAVAGHSLSTTQLQADAPGMACSVSGGSSTSCAATLTFDGSGMVSGAPTGTLSYSTGASSATLRIFASGSVIPNPSYAS